MRKARRPIWQVWHTTLQRFVTVVKVQGEIAWVIHPKTGKRVASPRSFYDWGIRTDLDRQRHDLQEQTQTLRASRPRYGCRAVDPLTGSVWVWKVPQKVAVLVQSKQVRLVWSLRGPALVTRDQTAALVDREPHPAIRWVSRYPHRIFPPIAAPVRVRIPGRGVVSARAVALTSRTLTVQGIGGAPRTMRRSCLLTTPRR